MKLNFKNIKKLFFLFLGISFLFACPKPPSYSEIPEIDFKEVKLFDAYEILGSDTFKVKACKLKFGLIDGDGNVGLQPEEEIGLDVDSMYINNFFSILYEIKNGDTIIVDSFDRYNSIIPDIRPLGQNKTLIADVYIDLTFSYKNDTLLYDSIMFEFFMIDRDLNRSNLDKTPFLKLDTIGVFTD